MESYDVVVVGGGVAGRGISKLLRKTRATKPSTYRLKQVKVPRVDRTPATLMPRGKWRSTWEITRKGGTPALILKEEPSLMKVHVPVPVYRPSALEPGLGLLSGISPFKITEEKPTLRTER